jgi:hypothetical protein
MQTLTVDIIAEMWKPVVALVISSATVAVLWPATLIGAVWAISELLMPPNSTTFLADTITTYLPSVLGGAVSGFASLLVIRVISGRERVKLLLIASGLVGGAIVVTYYFSVTELDREAEQMVANLMVRVMCASAIGFWAAVLAAE